MREDFHGYDSVSEVTDLTHNYHLGAYLAENGIILRHFIIGVQWGSVQGWLGGEDLWKDMVLKVVISNC